MKYYKPLLTFISLLFTICSYTQHSADFTISRTTGFAPLAVLFDASTTTTTSSSVDAFHELCYRWDFGDNHALTWNHSGKLQNTDTAPITGHIFTEAGSYTITLTVSDGISTSTHTHDINVSDPDIVFSGINTVCISNTNNFIGIPSGAQQVFTTDFSVAMSHIAANTRVLFRRNETWTTNTVGHNIQVPNGLLGAFGIGTNPIINVNATSGDLFALSNGSAALKNYVIRDLDIRMQASGAVDAFARNGNLSEVTFYNIKMDGFEKGLNLAPSVLSAGVAIFEKVSMIECEITNVAGGSGGYGVYVGSEQFLFMGNKVDDATNGEHCIRFPFLQKGVITHNYLAKPANNKHIIKLHSGSFSGGTPVATQSRYSEQIVIANNKLIGANNAWNVTLGPQSASNPNYDERVRDVIVEKNFFLGTSGNQVHLIINAGDVTVRNNIFNLSNLSGASTAVSIFKRGFEPVPQRIDIYNNTAVRDDGNTFDFIVTDSNATSITYCNNLAYAISSSLPDIHSGSGSISDCGTNQAYNTNPGFSGTDFSLSSSYSLIATAIPIDAGIIMPTCDDFNDNPRNDTYDVGAFEISATIVQIKVFLQGAFSTSDMTNTLQTASMLPTTDPYGLGESVTTFPSDVVDWVKVEIRDPLDSTNVLTTRACFVRKDGMLIDLDGSLGVKFPPLSVNSGFITVHHRNHLAVMTNSAISF